jgi:MerR family transcriptional regulator, light-induced transcriptional regulator
MTFSQLQLGLLAPTARRLNALWENDDVSFLDVTLATGNLQRMMRFVAIDLMPVAHPRLRRKAILIAPAPGEGHGFGAAMAAEFFRRDGWVVHHDASPTVEGLAATAAAIWVDVVGFRSPPRAMRGAARDGAAGAARVDQPAAAGHRGG